jgi:hypothetical protein
LAQRLRASSSMAAVVAQTNRLRGSNVETVLWVSSTL